MTEFILSHKKLITNYRKINDYNLVANDSLDTNVKQMKTQIIISVLMLLSINLFAQRIVEEKVKCTKDNEINLKFEFADDIKVQVWNKNEVYIKATVSINKNENNEAFKFETKTFGNDIIINSEIENMKELCKEEVIIGKNGEKHYHSNLKMDLNFEVFIPQSKELEIKTISGNIEVLGFEGEMNIETISGFVDVSLPETQKADVKCKTITGGIYTDLDDKLSLESKKDQIVGAVVNDKMNGGGKDIELSSISGDIYLRKLK